LKASKGFRVGRKNLHADMGKRFEMLLSDDEPRQKKSAGDSGLIDPFIRK
jgi:hypothetical protein